MYFNLFCILNKRSDELLLRAQKNTNWTCDSIWDSKVWFSLYDYLIYIVVNYGIGVVVV